MMTPLLQTIVLAHPYTYTLLWVHSCSYRVKELSLMLKSSYQVFDFAWKKNPTSDGAFLLMCQTASYILHIVAKLDECTAKDLDSEWQWEDRSKVFGQIKEALSRWIARTDVIGGSMFGGDVSEYYYTTSTKKNRGKRELQVHHFCCWFYMYFILSLPFSSGIHYF